MITAWTTDWSASVSDVVIRVKAIPASAGTPAFSSACGSADGTSTCDLGKVDAGSAGNQLQVRVTVPASATAVTAVSLTASASASELTSDAKTSVPVCVTAPAAAKQNRTKQIEKAAATPATPTPGTPAPATESTAGPALSTGSLMALPSSGSGPTLNPGGSAAGLFPTLNPTQAPSASAAPNASRPNQVWNEGSRPMANTSALPEGTSAIGAQLVGLAALALAFLLAATRLTLRRRPAAKPTASQDGEEGTPGNAG
jgi:hypothetical protein